MARRVSHRFRPSWPRRWPSPRAWWLRAALVVAAPLCALNLAVAFFGSTVVFPLSPFALKGKAHALGAYFRHRALCVFTGHPDPQPLIAQAERRHHLPRGLLAILLDVESGQRPHRISSSGAMGMAQLLSGTARQLQVTDPYNTEEAVEGSARYLSDQLVRFKDVRLAVAAYNAGPGNVGRTVPVNGETEYYVARITSRYAKARALARHP